MLRTATQHLVDAAQVAELAALKEELEKTLEKTKEPQKNLCSSSEQSAMKELHSLQEQVTSLWRQIGVVKDEVEVLSPTVKHDLLGWKNSISGQVSEHEGRLKCLAETAGVAASDVWRAKLSEDVQLLRSELQGLREKGTMDPEATKRMEEILSSEESWRRDIANLREEMQSLPKQSELQHLQEAMSALTTKYEASPQPETSAPTVSSAEEAQALRASLAALSDEMTTSRREWSKLQEEVQDFY